LVFYAGAQALFQICSCGRFNLRLGPPFAFLFTHVFGWHYLFATGIAFLTAVSINYLLSRRFVFKGTLRSVHAGYVGFLSIAALGLLWVTGLMFVCVEYLGWGYLPDRVAVAAVVGIWNYLLNLYVNFKVVGMHRENQG
jgi:putative flippase GtrA